MSDAVNKFKQFILEPEYADALKRRMDKSYWSDSGEWVDEAIGIIERTINSCEVDETTRLEPWLNEVIAKVEEKYEYFRDHARDPDGYGCGTFRQVLNRMYDFRDSLEPSAADTEESESSSPPPKTDKKTVRNLLFFFVGLILFIYVNLSLHGAESSYKIELYSPVSLHYERVCTLSTLEHQSPIRILGATDFTTPLPQHQHWKLSSKYTPDKALTELQDHCFILKQNSKPPIAGVVLSLYTERLVHFPTIFLSGTAREPELISDLFH